MTGERATIIEHLIDAAEYAVEVLENYADVDDGDDGRPTPNKAMLALMQLNDALEVFRRHRAEPKDDGRIL